MKSFNFNKLVAVIMCVLTLNFFLSVKNIAMVNGATLKTGRYVKLSLDDKYYAGVDEKNLTKWIAYLDDVYLKYSELVNKKPVNGVNIVSVNKPGVAWVTNNIINLGSSFNIEDLKDIVDSDWHSVIAEQMSYIFDFDGRWNFDNASTYIKTAYMIEQTRGKAYYDKLYASKKISYNESFMKGKFSSDGLTYILMTIKNKVGWDPFKKVFWYFNTLSSASVPATKIGKFNLFMLKLKQYSGIDVLAMLPQTDKNLVGKALGGTIRYDEPTSQPVSKIESTLLQLIKDQNRTVYWVESGKSFHSTNKCSTLKRSTNILNGPYKSCPKTDPCNTCIRIQ